MRKGGRRSEGWRIGRRSEGWKMEKLGMEDVEVRNRGWRREGWRMEK